MFHVVFWLAFALSIPAVVIWGVPQLATGNGRGNGRLAKWGARLQARDVARNRAGGQAYRFFVAFWKVALACATGLNLVVNGARISEIHVSRALIDAFAAVWGIWLLTTVVLLVVNRLLDRRIAAGGGA